MTVLPIRLGHIIHFIYKNAVVDNLILCVIMSTKTGSVYGGRSNYSFAFNLLYALAKRPRADSTGAENGVKMV